MNELSEEQAIIEVIKGQPAGAAAVTEIMRPPTALQLMGRILRRALAVEQVTTKTELKAASGVAEDIKGWLDEVELKFRILKDPINKVGRFLDHAKHEIISEPSSEYRRVSDLIAGYINLQNLEKEREELRRREEERKRQEEHNRKIAEMQREQEQIAFRLRQAEDLKTKKNFERQIRGLEEKIEGEKIGAQLEMENVTGVIKTQEPRVLPPGGKSWTEYQCEVSNVELLFQSHPELLEWKLRKSVAQALAKDLDAHGKPLDSIPGLVIKKVPRTAFMGATSIRMEE